MTSLVVPLRRRPPQPSRLAALTAKLETIASLSPADLAAFDRIADLVLARLLAKKESRP